MHRVVSSEPCPELNCPESEQIAVSGRCCKVCRGMEKVLLLITNVTFIIIGFVVCTKKLFVAERTYTTLLFCPYMAVRKTIFR